MTGKPAKLSKAMNPTDSPPRKPGDPAIISLQAELLDCLEKGSKT